MLNPRKDKLPEGYLLCKPCNGTGANTGRTDKRGTPLRCSKCKGRGMVSDPNYMSEKERARQRRDQTTSVFHTRSHGWNDSGDTSTW